MHTDKDENSYYEFANDLSTECQDHFSVDTEKQVNDFIHDKENFNSLLEFIVNDDHVACSLVNFARSGKCLDAANFAELLRVRALIHFEKGNLP